MTDNLPQDQRDVAEDYIVGRDRQGNELTHSALAERLMQVEAHRIQRSITEDNDYTVLAYILEGGFRGYHKFSAGELWSEWTDVEDQWISLFEDSELPWEIHNEDPLALKKETV